MEIIKVIELLRDHLPDSRHDDDESWGWCWEELSGDAQEAVIKMRRVAWEFISEHQTAQCVHYACAACGGIVPLPPDVEVLDSGTGLTCPTCGGTTVVDLDTPGKRTARYRAAERGYRYDEL